MSDSSADRNPLDPLAEEFVARFRAGERPSLTEYATRYPELADDIRELFPALVEMEQLKPVSADNTGAFVSAGDETVPDRIGEFRILRQVGRGGMGVVYEAMQESLGRHVALKVLPAETLMDPKRRERFRREARSAARLHHTNIVPVFGTGEADGRHFYAMQFIYGHPLDAVIDEVRRLREKSSVISAGRAAEVAHSLLTGTFSKRSEDSVSPRPESARGARSESAPLADSGRGETGPSSSHLTDQPQAAYARAVARIGAQAADALAYAHGQGILHRDVKPANLLLDHRGTVWVTDFGLAKADDSENLTQDGDMVGTLRYMAPERFDGQGDQRADVYALGLTLYELLTLRPAYAAEARGKLVEQVLAATPPAPRSVNPAIPRDLQTVVQKAIERVPDHRYSTASELAEDLRRFVDDEPIKARQIGVPERAWRWCRRNPAIAGLVATVAVLLVLGTAISATFALRAAAERNLALIREAEADEARRQADAETAKLKAEQAKTDRLLYVSQINHAQTAALELRTPRLTELLDETRPQPGRDDVRGWEWHYLNRLTRSWDAEVKLDAAAVPGLVERSVQSPANPNGDRHHSFFTRDGTRLLVPPLRTSADGSALRPTVPKGKEYPGAVFDLASGKVLHLIPPPGSGPLDYGDVTFSPDGDYMAYAEPVAATSYEVRVVELASRQALPVVLPTFAWLPIVSLSARASRVTAWTAPRNGVRGRRGFGFNQEPSPPLLAYWDRGSTEPRSRVIPTGSQPRPKLPAAVGPDGTTAIVFADSGALEFWDLNPDPPALRASHSGGAHGHLQFSAGGAMVAANEFRGSSSVVVYDARTGVRVGKWNPMEAVSVEDVAQRLSRASRTSGVSDDGRRMILSTEGRTLIGGEDVRDMRLPSDFPTAPVRDADQRATDLGLWRSFILRGSADPGQRIIRTDIASTWLSADGSRLMATGDDFTVQAWNLARNPEFAATWPDVLTLNGALCFPQPDPRRRAVVYYPNERTSPLADTPVPPDGWPVAVYDPFAGRVTHQLKVKANRINHAQIGPDGRRLLLAVGRAPAATPPRGNAPPNILRAAPTTYHWSLWSLDEPGREVELCRFDSLGAGFGGGVVTTYFPSLTDDGRWLIEPILEPTDEPPAGTTPQAAPVVRGYHLRRADDGALSRTIRLDGTMVAVGRAALNPDGNRLALMTREEPQATDSNGPAALGLVTIRCYDAATGEPIWALPMPGMSVSRPSAVAYSPDGRRLAVARKSDDGLVLVRVLDEATGQVERELRAADADPDAVNAPIISLGPGGWVVAGQISGTIVWDGQNPDPVHRLGGIEWQTVKSVFSSDGRRLFIMDSRENAVTGRIVRVWDLETGRQLMTFRVPTRHMSGLYVGLGAPTSWQGEMWVDGDRFYVRMADGVRVFDGTPLPQK